MIRQLSRIAPRTFLVFVACLLASPSSSLFADTLFESASLGATGFTYPEGALPWTGHVISPIVYTGVVFELPRPAVTTRIGGHFVRRQISGADFFGAIISLTGPNDLPDSDDFSTPDVFGSVDLSFPSPSAETFGDLSLRLEAGWYALVFASGHFGTSGQGATVSGGVDLGSPTYIAWVYSSNPALRRWFYSSSTFDGQRMVVEGRFVPEPSSSALGLLALAVLSAIRSRRLQR